MWIGLTGSPRIAGVEYANQASASGHAVDESIISERRGGLEVVLEERFRPVGDIVWTVDEATGLALQSDLGYVCDLDARTHEGNDPAWAQELTVRARRTSDIEMSAPLGDTDAATGRPVVEIRFSWRSLATYTLAELGIGVGGYRRLNATTVDADGHHDLEPYGAATLVETGYPVSITDPATGQPVQGTRYYADLGDDRTAALRIEHEPGGTLLIQTRD